MYTSEFVSYMQHPAVARTSTSQTSQLQLTFPTSPKNHGSRCTEIFTSHLPSLPGRKEAKGASGYLVSLRLCHETFQCSGFCEYQRCGQTTRTETPSMEVSMLGSDDGGGRLFFWV